MPRRRQTTQRESPNGRVRDLEVPGGAGIRGGAGWTWMQSQRVWSANRAVFVYPENWLDPDPK